MQSINSNFEDPFHTFERTGWETIPREYHDGFGNLTMQAIEPLLDAAGVTRGTGLLDVATGPGYAAAAAAKRGATVLGIDFSVSMLAEARRSYPFIDFREGDAEALAFPDSGFGAVVMNFGMLHLAKPDQAITEAHRVLGSGGRFGFTAWANPDEAVGFGIVLNAVRAHGVTHVPLPAGPAFFRFSDPEECARALVKAGFVQPNVTRVPQTWRLVSAEALFQIMLRGTVRTAGLLRAQTAEALKAIRRAVHDAVAVYRREDAFELPMPAVLASARKP